MTDHTTVPATRQLRVMRAQKPEQKLIPSGWQRGFMAETKMECKDDYSIIWYHDTTGQSGKTALIHELKKDKQTYLCIDAGIFESADLFMTYISDALIWDWSGRCLVVYMPSCGATRDNFDWVYDCLIHVKDGHFTTGKEHNYRDIRLTMMSTSTSWLTSRRSGG